MSTTTKAGYGQPALIGGAVMGVLSALPLVSAGNLCCCLWVVSGGLVGAYVLQQNQSAPITANDGALVGLLAGLIGASIYAVLSIPISILMEPIQRAIAERLAQMGDVPNFVDRLNAGGSVGRAIGMLIGIVAMFFAGAIFSTLGGLLGAAIFAKRVAPATPEAPQA